MTMPESVNLMTLQPIINYNLNKGWYLTSVPGDHCQLDGLEQQPMDGTTRRRVWQDRQVGQAAPGPFDAGLL